MSESQRAVETLVAAAAALTEAIKGCNALDIEIKVSLGNAKITTIKVGVDEAGRDEYEVWATMPRDPKIQVGSATQYRQLI